MTRTSLEQCIENFNKFFTIMKLSEFSKVDFVFKIMYNLIDSDSRPAFINAQHHIQWNQAGRMLIPEWIHILELAYNDFNVSGDDINSVITKELFAVI